jgi:competence ComEA-like helix-hairpin-helix protein
MSTTRQASFPAGWLIIAAGIVLAASIATTAAVRPDKPTGPQDTAVQGDDELAKTGEPIVSEMCGSNCHGLDNLEVRRSVNEWNSLITQMIDRGLSASDKDLAIILQYLKRFHGIVAVNIAPAAEFSAVLGLSPKDAQAVVDYRAAHGKFADVAALKQVPEIDKTKIDEQPEALRFR